MSSQGTTSPRSTAVSPPPPARPRQPLRFARISDFQTQPIRSFFAVLLDAQMPHGAIPAGRRSAISVGAKMTRIARQISMGTHSTSLGSRPFHQTESRKHRAGQCAHRRAIYGHGDPPCQHPDGGNSGAPPNKQRFLRKTDSRDAKDNSVLFTERQSPPRPNEMTAERWTCSTVSPGCNPYARYSAVLRQCFLRHADSRQGRGSLYQAR
jgi:hypothetical protein